MQLIVTFKKVVTNQVWYSEDTFIHDTSFDFVVLTAKIFLHRTGQFISKSEKLKSFNLL